MDDPKVDPDTPASPDPGPNKAHGDAFLDQSGSRHGTAPTEPEAAGHGLDEDGEGSTVAD